MFDSRLWKEDDGGIDVETGSGAKVLKEGRGVLFSGGKSTLGEFREMALSRDGRGVDKEPLGLPWGCGIKVTITVTMRWSWSQDVCSVTVVAVMC